MKNKHLVLLFLLCLISVVAYKWTKSANKHRQTVAHYHLEAAHIMQLSIPSRQGKVQEWSIHLSDNGWVASAGTKHIPVPPERMLAILEALSSMRPTPDTARVPDSLLREVSEIAIQTTKGEKVLYLGKPVKRKGNYATPARLWDKKEPVSIDFHWLEGEVGNLYTLDFQQFRNTRVLPTKLPEWTGLAYAFADFSPLYLTQKEGIWQRLGTAEPSAAIDEYVKKMLQSIRKMQQLQPSDDFDPAVEKEAFFCELLLEEAPTSGNATPITLLCFRRNYGKSVYFLKSSYNDSEVFSLSDTLANQIFVVPALGIE